MNILKLNALVDGKETPLYVNASSIIEFYKLANGHTHIVVNDGSIEVGKDVTKELSIVLRTLNNGTFYTIN